MGKKVEINDFLGFYDTAFTVIPEGEEGSFSILWDSGQINILSARRISPAI